MNQLVSRRLRGSLELAFDKYSCVLLLGPRQVGKTTLAREFAEAYQSGWTYKDLEQENDRRAMEHFDGFVAEHDRKIIVLDEAQCMSEVFPKLRSTLDMQQVSGEDGPCWLILGSATQDLEGLANRNLAGRFRRLDLTPFDISEINPPQSMVTSSAKIGMSRDVEVIPDAGERVESHDLAQRLWLKGGFPRSYLENDDVASLDWRCGYLESVLGPETPARKEVVKVELLGLLWQHLAIKQGGTCDVHKLPGKLGCKRNELESLLHFLEHQNLIRAVRPWSQKSGKRLERQPLWFIRDSGLLHSQLGVKSIRDLQNSEFKGKSWEGFVLESLLMSAPPNSEIFYYRNKEHQEVDFVLKLSADLHWVIEVKYGTNHNVSPGFYYACDKLRPERKFVIHAGKESFKRGDAGRLDWFCLSDAVHQFT